MKKITKLIFIFLFVSLILPNLAFASWWNPISWFTKEQTSQNIIVVSSSTTPFSSTTGITVGPAASFRWWNPVSWFNKSEKIEVNNIATSSSTTTQTTTSEVNKFETDNSVIIKNEVEKQVKAALKVKTDEDVRIAQEKLDEQKLNEENIAKLKLQAQQANALYEQQQAAQNAANLAAQQTAQLQATQEAANLAAQQRAVQDAANQLLIQTQNEKKAKLNAVNLKIVDLNAKYLEDVANARKRVASQSSIDGDIASITRQYNIDYNILTVEYQRILYGN